MKLSPSIAVLCLGHGLVSKSMMSETLIGRLRGALQLLNELSLLSELNSAHLHLILSGGDVKGLGVTEAYLMKEYVDLNAKSSFVGSLLTEEKSRNTLENMLYCAPYLENLECDTAHIVTSEYHLPRAMLCARTVLPKSIKCIGHATKSAHKRNSIYRPVKDRPADHNKWNLCEILDWEVNGVKCLQSALQKRKMNYVASADDINLALEEIRYLNKTYGMLFGSKE